MPEMMTTREVADYLPVKERKIYDLIRQAQISCARVSGKWLFPKALIDRWVMQSVQGAVVDTTFVPSIIAGSHDPLLEWRGGIVRGAYVGSGNRGLQHPMGRACVVGQRCGRDRLGHAPAGAGGGCGQSAWNSNRCGFDERRARRSASGWCGQPGCCWNNFSRRKGLARSISPIGETIARTEADLGAMIVDGKADAGLAIGAAASMFRLDFLPLHEKRFDLIVRRREFFDEPFQTLLDFTRSPEFEIKAGELGGYDVFATGAVVWNGVSEP